MNIPLNIDFQQILLHLLNFAILGGGLYLLLYKPVKQFMEKRDAFYQQEHDSAAQDRAQAEEYKKDCEAKLQNLETELQQKRADAQQEIDQYRQAQRKEAQAQADQLVADAHAAAQREHDKLLAQSQQEIRDLAMTATEKLLLQQQPVASDLRLISSALKMITDIERIGDQASDIAEIVTCLSGACGHNKHIDQMAQATIKMVTDSLDAFVRRDLTLAWSVIEYDDVVDRLFDECKQDLIAEIAQNPTDGERVLDVLMIAKYLERIGDHATNIAEWVEFSITGTHKSETHV